MTEGYRLTSGGDTISRRPRALITGSTGLIGSTICRELRQSHTVVTAGRSPNHDIQLDLSEPETIRGADPGPIDVLIHCAGVVDEDFAVDTARALRTAVLGAETLVTVAQSVGATKLVYLSSAHVYGPMRGRVDENSPPDPRSDYAIAHFATEQVFRRHCGKDTSGLVLRPCAVFGTLPDPARFRRWSLIPFAFPRLAALEGNISLNSTGDQRRNFVGTHDIAARCTAWLQKPAPEWTVENPMGTWSGSVYEFARVCAAEAELVSGRPCSVSRPASSGPTFGSDFEYGTTRAGNVGAQSLTEAVRALVLDLSKEI